MKYRIPYGSIQYYRSDRNYVYLHLVSGSEYAFLGKLSGIEAQVPKALFVRVHQSYDNRNKAVFSDEIGDSFSTMLLTPVLIALKMTDREAY